MIPVGDEWHRHNFDCALPADLGNPPSGVTPMTEDEIAKDMEGFITAQPRSWKELITRYLAQPYPLVYRGFGRLRHKLGRANDGLWFPSTFAGHDFSSEKSTILKLAILIA